ncbi:MAG: hypothetical protein GX413_06410 [Acetobacter sp.]|nr:hypothetical protein [Acetobacter sp.]
MYIINVTNPDRTDSSTIKEFAHEAANFALSILPPYEVRRIEDSITRQEWFGEDIKDFIALHTRD